MKRNQTGFTLIEIAIVLVIIGLLLGGVLKGQELINSAKVKNLANDFKNTPVLLYGYQDKFKAIPGDDANAASHVGITAATTPVLLNVGNGVIEGVWNTTTTTDESYKFWEQVRKAGLAAEGTGLPTNAVGGHLGVTGSNSTYLPISGVPGTFMVCADNIPTKLAIQIDATIDDGNTQTGSVRAVANGAAAGTVAVSLDANSADALYTVCSGS